MKSKQPNPSALNSVTYFMLEFEEDKIIGNFEYFKSEPPSNHFDLMTNYSCNTKGWKMYKSL